MSACERCERLEKALREIADNWDHDADAHRYGTRCFVCIAREALRPAAPQSGGKLICDGQTCAYCGVQHRTAAPQESAPTPSGSCGHAWNEKLCPKCGSERPCSPCGDGDTAQEFHKHGSEQPDHKFSPGPLNSQNCSRCGYGREAHRRSK